MLAQWQEVHLSFPDKQVLNGVSLSVHRGEKIALVGENGAGKSSLFRILLGELTPDSGEVSITAGARIGYLKQTLADIDGGGTSRTCMEVALSPFRHLNELEQEIGRLSETLQGATDAAETARLLQKLGEAQEQFEGSDGYTYQSRVEATLSGAGLTAEVWDRPIDTLSSGQKARLGLARLLLGEYDVLLLDEPTNHLDVETREWLEDKVAQMETAYIVASHDRRFLDGTITKVAHLDRGRLTLYPGNFSAFRAQVAHKRAADWQVYEKRQKEVHKLQKRAREYRNWAGTKENEKRGAADKGFVGHRSAKLMKRAIVTQRRLETTIEKMKTEKPFEKDPVAIDFHATEGRRLLAAADLGVGYDPSVPLAQGLTCDIRAGDRMTILGPNGSGKTTVLRTLLGELPPLAGEVRLSPSARIGYFDQENRQIAPGLTALEAVWEVGKEKTETLVRTVMGRMRIQKETVYKRVSRLSAGERAKVLLARLILGDYNLLVLDEPTNHLDIETQDTLLDGLGDFPGGILFVSHDRHFIDTLATTRWKISRT